MAEEYQPGWYPDPSGAANQLRWWDGSQWTDQTAPAQQPAQEYQQPQNGYQNAQYDGQNSQNLYGYAPAQYTLSEMNVNLRFAAFVLNVISCVIWCWTLVALIWMIPMTVHSWRIYQNTARNTTAFAVCDLLFLNFIGGILLLISHRDA